MRSGRTLCTSNKTKIQNTSKCNIERIKASDKRFLFVCGDIELNPGPVNIPSMSVLTTRLAHIGRKPVNTIGDIKIQIRKKLKNHGKNPLLRTENQGQRKLKNHLKILQRYIEN